MRVESRMSVLDKLIILQECHSDSDGQLLKAASCVRRSPVETIESSVWLGAPTAITNPTWSCQFQSTLQPLPAYEREKSWTR